MDDCYRDLVEQFIERYGEPDHPPRLFLSPGRVNLIGEHIDYNGGHVLPAAVDMRFAILARRREDRELHGVSCQYPGQDLAFDLDDLPEPEAVRGGWGAYVCGVAAVLMEEGIPLCGADLLIDSRVPLGAGLSSSAALEVGVGLALTTLAGQELARDRLALLCQTSEHVYAGVPCGIMDQFAVALSRPGHALLLDCKTRQTRHVPLQLEGTSIVLADTKVERALVSSEYARRREECSQGLALLVENLGENYEYLVDIPVDNFEKAAQSLPQVVENRCRHVIEEEQRTLEAVAALESGDIAQLGDLMNGSHRSLRDLYQVSCAELDLLAEAAWSVPGCQSTLNPFMRL